MNITCYKCGYTSEVGEFKYLCFTGCPACGASELRECPKCGTHAILHKAEALDDEEEQMKELSKRLAAIPANSPDFMLEEAREIIAKLSAFNLRWNIPALDEFISERHRELGLGQRHS
ncbi:MAG: hypothetical protein SVY53_04670 [Chloroflexota bacterium]|nr:hypothetical protein [Chloroflexota bacterium]